MSFLTHDAHDKLNFSPRFKNTNGQNIST